MATRTEAAKNRLRHNRTGRFITQRTNGNTKTRGAAVTTPVGISSDLTRILRPQAAFRWILPPVAAITPQYLEMVMRGALAGNHVQQWELFSLMFDTWPTLANCYDELVTGVLTKKLVFEPYRDEDEKPTPQAIERCKLVSNALRGMDPDPARDQSGLSGTIADLLSAWVAGTSVQEVLWHSLDDGTMAPKSTFWVHPVAFGWSQDGILGLRSVSPYQPSGYASTTIGNKPAAQPFPSSYLQATPQPAVLETFPPDKFLIAIHKTKAGTALAGPMLRPLCWWWLASQYASDWLLNLAQLFGIPFRYCNYDPNAPDDTISAIFAALQGMGTAGWAAFPIGTTLEFKETGGGRGRQAEYSPQGTLLDRADRYARELILGQTMTGSTMTSGKGGQAFGIVEKDVKQERIDSAGKFACDIINKQLIPSILKLNYGDADEPPSIRLLEENEGQFVDAQRDQILKAIGLPIGVDFIRKKYGIPEPAEDEEILGPPQESQQEATREQALAPVGADGLPRRLDEKQPQDLGKSAENDTAQQLPSTNSEPAQAKQRYRLGHWVTHEGRHIYINDRFSEGESVTVVPYLVRLMRQDSFAAQ